jgi:hypothetical protein
MSAAKRDAELVQRAIDIYIRTAYPDGPPISVGSMLETLKGFAGDYFAAPAFVKDARVGATRYSLRLGNPYYPHMKLIYELGPDGQTFLFRADTHDAHCCPPVGAPHHDEFCGLMAKNQQVLTAIEQAWAAEGIPTFKTFLRDDLARRRASAAPGHAAGTA